MSELQVKTMAEFMIEEKEAAKVESAAKSLAGYVTQTGRAVRVFGAIPPVRKIMHTVVNDDEGIDNQSSGFGMFRHLVFNQSAPTEAPATETEEISES